MKRYTEWVKSTDAKPVVKGVYQVKPVLVHPSLRINVYSYFDGRSWHLRAKTPREALENRTQPTLHRRPIWRGLATNPENAT